MSSNGFTVNMFSVLISFWVSDQSGTTSKARAVEERSARKLVKVVIEV